MLADKNIEILCQAVTLAGSQEEYETSVRSLASWIAAKASDLRYGLVDLAPFTPGIMLGLARELPKFGLIPCIQLHHSYVVIGDGVVGRSFIGKAWNPDGKLEKVVVPAGAKVTFRGCNPLVDRVRSLGPVIKIRCINGQEVAVGAEEFQLPSPAVLEGSL